MEEIPDGEILYRYAFPQAFPEDQEEIPLSVFQDPELSCDWKKLRNDPRTSTHHFEAGRTTIISILICSEIKFPCNPRAIRVPSAFQEVLHNPILDGEEFGPNEAHSLIKGRKKMEAVTALRKNSWWGHT